MRSPLIAPPRLVRGRRSLHRLLCVEALEPKVLLAVTTQAVETITTTPVVGQTLGVPGASSVDIDAAGDSVVVGGFKGNLNLAGSIKFSTPPNSSQYVAKVDSNNQPVWVVYLKAAADDGGPTISDVAIAKDGSVFLAIVNAAGTQEPYNFYKPITPQNNNSVPQVQNNPGNQNETFSEIVKLDASGNLVYRTAIRARPEEADSGDNSFTFMRLSSLVVDDQGNVFTLGEYGRDSDPDTGDLGPDPTGVRVVNDKDFDLKLGDATFVLKLDSAGKAVWATAIHGGTADHGDGFVYSCKLALGPSGDISVVGLLSDTAKIGGVQFSPGGPGVEFYLILARLQGSDGKITLAKKLGTSTKPGQSSSTTFGIQPLSIDISPSGDLLIAGEFASTALFGTTTLKSAGGFDYFIASYDSAGNNAWVRSGGSTLDDYARGIAVDAQGRIYVAGNYQGKVSFGTATLTSAGLYDTFLVQLDPTGNFQAIQGDGASKSEFVTGLAVNPSGGVALAGIFAAASGASFGGSALPASGGGFLAKLQFVLPTAGVDALPAEVHTESIPVRWSGQPAGVIATYDVFASVDDGPLVPWLTGTALTGADYSGSDGHRYGFAVVATDTTGLRSTTPANPQASTLVKTHATTSVVVTASAGAVETGNPVTFTATVTTADAWAGMPAGTVQFLVDGVALGGPVALSGGRATSAATTALGIGSHQVTAAFAGTGPFLSSTSGQAVVNVAGIPVKVVSATLSKKKKKVNGVVLNFGGALDAASAGNASAYRLLTAGRDKKLGTKDDKVVPIALATYNAGANSVTLTPRGKLQPATAYRLVVVSSAAGVRDAGGRPLDGDHNGTPGGDAVFLFKGARISITAAESRDSSRP